MSLEKLIEDIKCILETESYDTFNGNIEKLLESAEVMAKALDYISEIVVWHDDKNQKVILTYGVTVQRARETKDQVDKICGGEGGK